MLVYYQTTANLRLRTAPSTGAHNIRTVPSGTLVRVLGQRGSDWYQVSVHGIQGYMYAEFLEFATLRTPGMPTYVAGSVTVMDVHTGMILYETNQHQLRQPASITKIMTALLVLENVSDLSEPIRFSRHAVGIPSYASRMGMRYGDTITVYEALYGLMLPSGNEVARALAEHVSGSVGAFVALMNQRAAELGALNTRFANPCGLPGANQRTTSFDMALIKREAIRHPVYNRIIATPYFYIAPTESNPNPRRIRNTNRLIHESQVEFDERVVGSKTGFTNAAQHTLVTYAYLHGRPVIVSVLFANVRGATFSDTITLLDFAQTLYTEMHLFDATWVQFLPLYQELDGEISLVGRAMLQGMTDLWVTLPTGFNRALFHYEMHLPPQQFTPVQVGNIVGWATVYAPYTRLGMIALQVVDVQMFTD
jgi:D-alanyl-D-alanine carboxypeptidase